MSQTITNDVPQNVIDYVNNNNIRNKLLRVENNNEYSTYYIDNNQNIIKISDNDTSGNIIDHLTDITDVHDNNSAPTDVQVLRRNSDGEWYTSPGNSIPMQIINIAKNNLTVSEIITNSRSKSDDSLFITRATRQHLNISTRHSDGTYLPDEFILLSVFDRDNKTGFQIAGPATNTYGYKNQRSLFFRLANKSGQNEDVVLGPWKEVETKDDYIPALLQYKVDVSGLESYLDQRDSDLHHISSYDYKNGIFIRNDYIADGGSDVYDNGCKIFFLPNGSSSYQQINLNYGNTLYKSNRMLVFEFRDIRSLIISGNLGADGYGSVVKNENIDLSTEIDNVQYKYSYKYTRDTGDPSIHHYVIHRDDVLNHNVDEDVQDDYDEYVFTSATTCFLFIFWGKDGGDVYGNDLLSAETLAGYISYNYES
jgi:hypothetical protein